MAAAYELFREQGYSNVGMTDIIRRSGGSLSTAYELFENKAGLLRAMVTEQFASLHEVISNIAATEGPPAEALKATARDFLRILLDPGSIAMRRSEEHTYKLQPHMRNPYAVFCLNKTKYNHPTTTLNNDK